MAAKLLIQQGNSVSELTSQGFNSVQYEAQANTRYELLDDHGNVIHDYTTRVEDGKLLIDVAGTSASPDFILNNYTSYFPAPASGSMGSGYFGTASAESVASTAVKASAVGATSSAGGSGMLLGGLLGLAAIGGIAAAASGGSSKDKDKDNTANSGSQSTPNTNTNTGNQAVPSNTDKNTAGTNSTSPAPSNNSGSQTAPSTDKNTGGTNNTNTTPNNNTGSQTVSNTDNNSGSQNTAVPSTKDVLHGNSIKLPTAYTHKVLSGSDLNAITKAATGGVEMNQYQSNAENKKIIISDLNNLSREVQTELSLFVAQLLNPIRKQWNVGTLKVTDGAMDFAKDVADTYTSDKKSIFLKQGHYVAGITKAAEKYGLNTKNNFYENLGGFKTSMGLKNLSLDDLKHHVYDSVVRMLFADANSDHGHAKSLLNAMKYADQNAATDYLGVDTSNAFGDELNMHFIQATDNDVYVKDRTTFAAKIQTPEITSMPTEVPKIATRMAYLDDDNSHLSTTQFGESDDSAAPQITQKFTFSQLLEGNVRQLADEYDENDVLALSQNAFSALNKDQSNLHEHISYDSATGLLSYDADGVSGSISPVAFAQLAQGLQQDQIQFEIL